MAKKATVMLTGSSGTIGKPLCKFLDESGYHVVCWNMAEVPINNYDRMDSFISEHAPEALFHLAANTSLDENDRKNSWQENVELPAELAWICRQHAIKFIFTSTAMVFSSKQQGPFRVDAVPEEHYGYGYEKRMAEQRVFSQNPEALVLRLGWQIGTEGKNTMNRYLDEEMNQRSVIYASRNWYPSCSFIEDTNRVLISMLSRKPGLYQCNANTNHSFYAIAKALKTYYHKDWEIIPVEEPVMDNRMVDDRIQIPDLGSRLFISDSL
jgi:dTDP-4-dehydrorhamnose reductase